jgi:hypothetical protein
MARRSPGDIEEPDRRPLPFCAARDPSRGSWLVAVYRILLLLVSFSWLDIDQLRCGLPDPDKPRLLAGDWIKSLLSVLSFYYASQGA